MATDVPVREKVRPMRPPEAHKSTQAREAGGSLWGWTIPTLIHMIEASGPIPIHFYEYPNRSGRPAPCTYWYGGFTATVLFS